MTESLDRIIKSGIHRRAERLLVNNFFTSSIVRGGQVPTDCEHLVFGFLAGSSLYGGYPDGTPVQDLDIYILMDSENFPNQTVFIDLFSKSILPALTPAILDLPTIKYPPGGGAYPFQTAIKTPVLDVKWNPTAKDGSGKKHMFDVQIIPSPAETLEELIRGFDYAHCQVGIPLMFTCKSDFWRIQLGNIDDVITTYTFDRAMIIPQLFARREHPDIYIDIDQPPPPPKAQARAKVCHNYPRTWYVSKKFDNGNCRNPRGSMKRLKKFYERGMYGWGPLAHDRLLSDWKNILEECVAFNNENPELAKPLPPADTCRNGPIWMQNILK